jgi:hypothetical protein
MRFGVVLLQHGEGIEILAVNGASEIGDRGGNRRPGGFSAFGRQRHARTQGASGNGNACTLEEAPSIQPASIVLAVFFIRHKTSSLKFLLPQRNRVGSCPAKAGLRSIESFAWDNQNDGAPAIERKDSLKPGKKAIHPIKNPTMALSLS